MSSVAGVEIVAHISHFAGYGIGDTNLFCSVSSVLKLYHPPMNYM